MRQLWIFTLFGLIAFSTLVKADEWEWETFTNTNHVNQMVVEADTLWWATTGGVVKFSLIDTTILEIYHREDGLCGNYVTSMVIDQFGDRWFGTRHNYLCRLTAAGVWETYDQFTGIPTDAKIQCMTLIGDSLWVGTDQGVGCLDLRNTQNGFKKPWLDVAEGLIDNDVRAILADSTDLWFGTRNGIAVWHDFTDWTMYQEESFATDEGIDCRDLAKDWLGGIVSASGMGLYRFSPEEDRWKSIADLNNREMVSVAVYDSLIWASSYSSNSYIYQVYLQGTRWRNRRVTDGLSYPRRSLAFTFQNDGTVWTSNWGAGIAKLEDDLWHEYSVPGIIGNHVKNVERDNDGDLWVGIQSDTETRTESIAYKVQQGGMSQFSQELNQWVNYTTDDGLLINTVYSFAIAPDNNVWCSQWPMGFMELDDQGTIAKEDDRWIQVIRPTIQSEVVNTVYRDLSDHIWIGTFFWDDRNSEGVHWGGAEVYLPTEDRFVWWGAEHIISADKNTIRDNVQIYDIHQADNDLYWFAGYGGISLLDTRGTLGDKSDDLHQEWYPEDGILQIETLTINVDSGGDVWTGGQAGLNRIDLVDTPLDKNDDTIETIFEYPMLDIQIDDDGYIWCVTQNMGVIRYDPATGESIQFNQHNSPLPLDFVNSILIEETDTSQILWFATGLGLQKVTISSGIEPVPSSTIDAPFPNPFMANNPNHTKLNFDGLAPDAVIQIYDLTGELIYESIEPPNTDGIWQWNVTNAAGEMVASGVYLFVIDSKSNGIRIGKFAIIR